MDFLEAVMDPMTDPMGLFFLLIFQVDFYGFHVGRYTSPMDAMGVTTCNFLDAIFK